MSAAPARRGHRWLLPSLAGYRRQLLPGDVIAGVTLAAIAIPEQMATAKLAGMPATAGLIAFVVGSTVFALIGTHRLLSVGADSTIAPILAAAVLLVAPVGAAAYGPTMALVGVLVAVTLIVIGAGHFGWLAEFLSRPAVVGLLAGISVQIAMHQLPAVLGLPGGSGTVPERLAALWPQLGQTRLDAVLIAAGVLAVILVGLRVDHRVPGALVGVVAATLAVALLHLDAHGLPILGAVPAGLPGITIPTFDAHDLLTVLPAALTVAFVCVAQTAATEQPGLQQHAPGSATAPASATASASTTASVHATAQQVPASLDRDLVAIGVASGVAGLVGGFPVDSSPPRTDVVRASGGASQVAGLVAAAIALGITLFATGLLRLVPEAALGAILLYVASHLLRVGELRRIGAFDKVELGIALVTALVVVCFGIEQGVITAVVLSLADRTRRESRPTDAVLGRVPGTDHWVPSDIGRPTEQVPGVLVYLVYAPLWYAAAEHVQTRIDALVAAADPPVRGLVLDLAAVSDIDYTGALMLDELLDSLVSRGVTVAIARPSHVVHHDLKHSGLLQQIPADRLCDSVDDAVRSLVR